MKSPLKGSFGFLAKPPRFLFFTGKGGVGKTTLACAVAVEPADSGKRVLIVSTDPASNLDEMLDTRLADTPRPVTGAPNLFAMNIDPEQAGAINPTAPAPKAMSHRRDTRVIEERGKPLFFISRLILTRHRSESSFSRYWAAFRNDATQHAISPSSPV